MSDKLENNDNDPKQETTVYEAIGIAIFFIFAGVAYAFPDMFPEGTLYVVFGVLVALVNILKAFTGIKCYVFNVALVATGSILIGVSKVFVLGITIWPIIFIAVGVAGFLVNINRLRVRRK